MLQATGRDIEDVELTLEFSGCRWSICSVCWPTSRFPVPPPN
ncbi:MAG: hypothetical protein U0L91_11750 [Gemmiger sp.]|nr:hypothetical protein [Gemmiger sp.]MEE0801922.1 hypothetical protein [Gemmiger sp.]